ncbi:hypothetical protein EMIHUDRAFT_200796 [Emiliania huxleyi CCMP1516]|uniref:DUF218 domain-containing protein n=2 Tax=Emiliania huxleyi TaxID=2903 RepID=A0A0D3KR60_EMIH1|nr:hypothetical protein EMIHUDRAFT_200796 [Emiliania huxleyi CCMP1516]EOD38245.1 hypothetical protein EMIHUDRAFT_200796 [Emiliania huxleyi CCMP1516]|eukprot:XP_005790674.1 hypothetical protein EMIHUDRAFT_200796 [Emiliania huxleyi CCMP1516]
MLLLAISALASVTAAPSTGIVVHGFHCNAPRWEEVVWGDEAAQRLGRLPHAALLAWQARHELQAFICGSGASQTASGSAEADALISLLFERLPLADTESLNTQQEVLAALARLSRLGVQRALLVSSPTHMPRCLRDASVAAGTVLASPCGTSWTEETAVVVEPPHRPDGGASAALFGLVRRAAALAFGTTATESGRRPAEFLAAFERLLASFENRKSSTV